MAPTREAAEAVLESIQAQLRRVTRKRGAFPTAESVLRVLDLALLRASECGTLPIRDWRSELETRQPTIRLGKAPITKPLHVAFVIDAFRRIAFARLSSRTSRSSSFSRACSPVVSPALHPWSRSAWRTQVPERLIRAADLLGDGLDRSPLRRVLALVLEHHPNRPLPHLGGVRLCSGHDPNLSRVGASSNPRAVQTFSCSDLGHETHTETSQL